MDEKNNGTPQQPDAEGTQPTQVSPASQPGYQDGYQRGAQAGYAAGYQAGRAGGAAPAGDAAKTQQRPPVPDGMGANGGSASGAGQGAPVPAAPDAKGPRPHHPGVRAVLLGVAGGVVGAAALTGILLGTGVIGKSSTTFTNGSSQAITITPSDNDTSTATAVAAKSLPSVVTVNCTYDSGEGLGSGVIMDTDGNIITNNHVVEDADSITVTINGKSYDASLVGTDSSSDLAVIKADLQGDSVTPIEVGDSSALQVGDWVMSVGSPFGLEQSVSQGIVSALTRNELMQSSSGNTLYTNLIQVDAAINPGNSGGALVNDQGQLVGICTLYSSDTQSFAGIGFAIPGNYAVDVAQKIVNGEQVTHAYIGLSMQTVNAQNAKANKLSVSQGAYVADVTSGSPADEAGIQKGDIIIGIGDTQITSADGAILAVRSHNIGDTVTVTVMRGSEQKSFDVTLGSDEELQKQQEEEKSQPVSDLNSTTNGTTNGYGQDESTIMQQFQQWLQQQQNGYGQRQR